MGVVFIVMFAVVAIVAIEKFTEVYKARLKAREKDDYTLDAGIMNRINRIEERIGNLETIIVKSEREREFKDLEKKS